MSRNKFNNILVKKQNDDIVKAEAVRLKETFHEQMQLQHERTYQDRKKKTGLGRRLASVIQSVIRMLVFILFLCIILAITTCVIYPEYREEAVTIWTKCCDKILIWLSSLIN